jgi:hypothetical protein
MCSPIALGIAGGVVQGIGGFMQAMNTAAGYRANAALQERQAAAERLRGSYAAARKADEVRRITGAQVTAFASSGLKLTGSPATIIEDTATEGALDVAAIRFGAVVSSGNERFGAAVSRMNARSAAMAAPIAFVSPVINSAARVGAFG